MAFEDDMIEAGYSDEQEYLDSLLDESEEYVCQLERESENDGDIDSCYDEEEDQKKLEILRRCEIVKDWKKQNPDLSIIWQAYFSYISFFYEHHFPNEYIELNKWLYGRRRFEIERKQEDWQANLQALFSLYKNELFNFYFPQDECLINMSIITQQACELLLIKHNVPLLWETINRSYVIDDTFFEGIEEDAFWDELYIQEMDYEYWKDNNIEQYNQLVKQWIGNSSYYLSGEWEKKYEKEEIEWKKKKCILWERYRHNYETREKNKFIELKIDEYKRKHDVGHSIKNKSTHRNAQLYLLHNDYEDDDYDDLDEELDNNKLKTFLPDLECTTETLYDISSLNKELRQFIQDSICSLDMSHISNESIRYADKALRQLWLYTNRDGWGMENLKKYLEYDLRLGKKYSSELFIWWKDKYPTRWNEFILTEVPKFKKLFEVVMKFRLWALEGHKEDFFSLGEKYLPYWNKTIKFMYGEDIHMQLYKYFHNESYRIDYWGEDVDYIKKHVWIEDEVKTWQKELQDELLWECFYENNDSENYREHNSLESMYTSLRKEL